MKSFDCSLCPVFHDRVDFFHIVEVSDVLPIMHVHDWFDKTEDSLQNDFVKTVHFGKCLQITIIFQPGENMTLLQSARRGNMTML